MNRSPISTRSRRHALAVTAAISLFGAPAGLAPGAAAGSHRACEPRVTRLPDLGFGSEALATRGGMFVGDVMTDASGDPLPAIWQHGHLSVLDGFSSGFAGDINSRGAAVGTADNFTAAFVFEDGAVHLLPSGGSSFLYARRINDRRQIAGAAFDGLYAARWDSYASDPTPLLPAPGDASSLAKGINDAGIVAGDSDAASGVPYAAVWSATGEVRLLAPGFGTGQPGILYAINNAGEAVGESFLTDTAGNILSDQATAWLATGEPKLIPFLSGTNQSTALEVSDPGWVVGGAAAANYASGTLGPTHAFVWFGDGPAETLPVPALSYRESQSLAHGVDAHGTVVGSSGPAGGIASATVWSCARKLAYLPRSAATARVAVAHSHGRRGHLRIQAFLTARRRLRQPVN